MNSHVEAIIPQTGGCQCGTVRYQFDGLPLKVYVCHCTECRKQSASAFGISVIVRSADVKLTKGAVKKWSRPADSGRGVDCYFCPDCGSRIWHRDKDDHDTASIKGGSLDEPPDISSVMHIWTASKLAGVVIPGKAKCWPGEPD